MTQIDFAQSSGACQPTVEQTSFVIVTQVKSHRVVYFTDDPEYEPAMDGDWYYVSQYQGSLPDGMTLRNCWRWRFNGGVFVDARGPKEKTPQQLLIDSNRKALLAILKKKIDTLRAPIAPRCILGLQLRAMKLAQAQTYINNPAEESNYKLLQNVATARSISMHDAAQLIMQKAADTNRVLEETEQIREHFTQAILTAKTETELMDLRSHLLDEIYPTLSRDLKYKVNNTVPVNLDRELPQEHRVHEIARLKAQLRECINQARTDVESPYLKNEELFLEKEKLARKFLENNYMHQNEENFSLLEAYAEATGLSLEDAAKSILTRTRDKSSILVKTEIDKDRILAKINKIKTLRDIKNLSSEIGKLNYLD